MRVNCVAPGVIFSQTARDNYAFDVFSAAKPGIPAQRLGTPEEVFLKDISNINHNIKNQLGPLFE